MPITDRIKQDNPKKECLKRESGDSPENKRATPQPKILKKLPCHASAVM